MSEIHEAVARVLENRIRNKQISAPEYQVGRIDIRYDGSIYFGPGQYTMGQVNRAISKALGIGK